MRISDWSSDVCSSDLSFQHRPLAISAGASYFMFEFDEPAVTAIADQAQDIGPVQFTGPGLGAAGSVSDLDRRDHIPATGHRVPYVAASRRHDIARAPRRESVGQYV